MNKCLEYDLRSLVEEIELDIDEVIDECHLFLDYFKETNEDRLKGLLEKLSQNQYPTVYHELPYLIGYDTYLNRMKNYYIIIPVIQSFEASSVEDLYVLYKSLTYISEEMYDEYMSVKSNLEKSIQKMSNKVKKQEDKELYNCLIDLAISEKRIDLKYYNYKVEVVFKNELLSKVDELALNNMKSSGLTDQLYLVK